MREIRCRHCGYYLLSVEADAGRLHVTCKRCKRRQTVDLARVGDSREAERREAGREREATCPTTG